MSLANNTYGQLAQHLAATSTRAESFVFPETLTSCTTIELEELKNLDIYLEFLHENQPDRLNEQWVESILAASAFLGEVIRNSSPRNFQWMDYDTAISLGPDYAEFLGSRELAVHAVLVSLRGTAILPIYRVVMFILQGNKNSTYEFAVAEIDAPIEKSVPSTLVQQFIDLETGNSEIGSLGTANLETGENDEWEVIDEIDPSDPQFNLVDIGFRLLDAGQDDDARENFAQWLITHPGDSRAYKGLGDCHYFSGALAEAVVCYDKAIEFGNNDGETYLARGAAHAELGDFDSSLQDLDLGSEHSEKQFDVQMERASVMFRMGRTQDAIDGYSSLLSATNNQTVDENERLQVLSARANAYYEVNQFDQALKDISAAEILNSHDVDLFITAARIHELRSDFANSIAAYEKAIHCDDQHADGINGLAWVLATVNIPILQDGSRAKQLATDALQLADEQDKHIVLDTLAAACARLGEFEPAREYQRQAISEVDDDELLSDYQKRLDIYQNNVSFEC
jgi:tetratricopeptide (TPR) repeat protein